MFVPTYPENFWILVDQPVISIIIIFTFFCFLFSGGVVIYFDRIEVVNILEASSGEI